MKEKLLGIPCQKVNEEYTSLRTEAPFLNTAIIRKYTKIYRPLGTDSRIEVLPYSAMQTDNTYYSGLCNDSSHKKGIIDHIMKKTNLRKNSETNILEKSIDHSCVENEEYFSEIVDSKAKIDSLNRVLRPLTEIEPDLIKNTSTNMRRSLHSLRESPKLRDNISRTDSNMSITRSKSI